MFKRFWSILVLLILVLSAYPAFSEEDTRESQSDTQIIATLVNQEPDPAFAGDVVNARISVENRGGGDSESLVFEAVPEYPFEAVQGNELIQSAGILKAYQKGSNNKILKFRLRINNDVNAGRYNLKILQYPEGKKSQGNVVNTVSIDIKNKENAEVVYIDKVSLVPGSQTTVHFTINNVGASPLRDLTFSWSNPEGKILPVGTDNTKYIKYIDINDKEIIAYDVIADSDTKPGLYTLMLSLKYEDPKSKAIQEIATKAGIYVGGETDFDVAFSETSDGEMSFSISNVGSNPAYSVSVLIPRDQEGWDVTGSNNVILGNLNKGDYTVATFSINKKEVSDMQYLKVNVIYTDTSGARHVVVKDVDMPPVLNIGIQALNNQSGWKTAFFVVVVIAVILAVTGILFFFLRKLANK